MRHAGEGGQYCLPHTHRSPLLEWEGGRDGVRETESMKSFSSLADHSHNATGAATRHADEPECCVL